MSNRIIGFKAENCKRLKAVEIEFNEGVTVIGGGNQVGKTSIIDIIMSLVKGEKHTPSNPVHDGALKGTSSITLDSGVVISATYSKNGRGKLKITGMTEVQSPMEFLNSVFGKKALDISDVMKRVQKEGSKILLKTLGIDLTKFREKHKELYNKRTLIGRDADNAKGHFNELPFHEEIGDEVKSASKIIEEQKGIMLRNAENQQQRNNLSNLSAEINSSRGIYSQKKQGIEDLEKRIKEAREELENLKDEGNKKIALKLELEKTTENLEDESTVELENNLSNIEVFNNKVRQNIERSKAGKKCATLKEEYGAVTSQIEENKQDELDLLKGVKLPLPEMAIDGDDITYKGEKWDCMSTAERIMMCASIQVILTPNSKIVLVDQLESIDKNNMVDLEKWVMENEIQLIGTFVGKDERCDIIIEDGEVSEVLDRKIPDVKVVKVEKKETKKSSADSSGMDDLPFG